ncbi:MAG: hypothetical protein IPH20_06955 [Bacteroidales bacterium]|nr:hypothetical protein [Bacteroidales bacterium]
MKPLVVIFLLFMMNTVLAQDSIRIINYYEGIYPPKMKESYWVSKVDSSVRVGLYSSYFQSGKVWITGRYDNGKKTGVWNFNDMHTWEPYLKYDFDNNAELYYKSTYREESSEYYTFMNDSMITISKRPYCPEFLPYDSFKVLTHNIANKIVELNLVKSIENSYTIYFRITITETGEIQSEIVSSPFKNETSDRILLIINSSPKWIPAESNGKKVNFVVGWPLKLTNNKQ